MPLNIKSKKVTSDISASNISELCFQCIWKNQCGGPEPCSYFDPQDYQGWLRREYINNLHNRQQLSIGMSIEQGNYTEQE